MKSTSIVLAVVCLVGMFLGVSFSEDAKPTEKEQWEKRKKEYKSQIAVRQRERKSCDEKYGKKIEEETAELKQLWRYNQKQYRNRLRELAEADGEYKQLKKEADSIKAEVSKGQKSQKAEARLAALDTLRAEIEEVIHKGAELTGIKAKIAELDSQIEARRSGVFKDDTACARHLEDRAKAARERAKAK